MCEFELCHNLIMPKRPGTPGAVQRYCSAQCRRAACTSRDLDRAAEWNKTTKARKRARTLERRVEKACQICGALFVKHPNALTCGSRKCNNRRTTLSARRSGSKAAAKARYNARRAARGLPVNSNTPARRSADQRRRAVKSGSSIGPVFTPTDIAVRDKWICQLCGKRVNRRLVHPDPESATVDHIVPLSCGGEHSAANVQLAHLVCNTLKGVKAVGEQLRLIG